MILYRKASAAVFPGRRRYSLNNVDDEGKLKGYRIKKGVLGIEEDIEVILGPEPSRDGTFKARRNFCARPFD